MNRTHIEVSDDKGLTRYVKTGQLLRVTSETKACFWVRSFSGHDLCVNKKSKRITMGKGFRIHADSQPLMNA